MMNDIAAVVRLKDISSVVHSFVTQAGMNPRVSKPVCHISLSFSAQDKEKVTDVVMSKIAHEYMHRMGIKETQYIVARHHDKEHPHCHIIFNRINNNGKTISDSNDRFRSEKICKGLLVSLVVIRNQHQTIQRFRDNDLKYRYVKMRGEATNEDLYYLENIFTYNRNADSIRLTRRQVEQYERLVKEQAEKQEQIRLNTERADQLLQEAEAVKGGG